MSTRSYICIENENKTYTRIYCHSCGEPLYNGTTLALYYADRNKVNELISLGDLSLLCKKIHPDRSYPHSFNFFDRQENVCVFFGRDRGDENVSAKQTTLEEIDNDFMVDYCYVYGLDNKWYYFSIGQLKETGLIELDLNKIIELLNEEE